MYMYTKMYKKLHLFISYLHFKELLVFVVVTAWKHTLKLSTARKLKGGDYWSRGMHTVL